LSPAINSSPVSLTPVNSLSPVLLTPVINIHSRISPRIFRKKFETAPMEYLRARGTMIYEKKPEVENLVSDSLLCCPGHLFPNTPRMYQTKCF
jgi:hypothetical protein